MYVHVCVYFKIFLYKLFDFFFLFNLTEEMVSFEGKKKLPAQGK